MTEAATQEQPLLWKCSRISSEAIAARGGASIASTASGLLVFGGASREQQHFNDSWLITAAGGEMQLEQKNHWPSERSGQAIAADATGRAAYLWGGLNFTEETVYNDAWKWRADTKDWSKLRQLGDIPRSRNGHSLTVVQLKLGHDAPPSQFLVLFGGAGPETGPLSDSFVAVLPSSRDTSDEGNQDMLTWHPAVLYTEDDVAEGSVPDNSLPAPREMHAAAQLAEDSVIVTGGRGATAIFDDVWVLSPEMHEAVSWKWTRRDDLQLPFPRCSHASAVIDGDRFLCVVGGFSGEAVLNDVLLFDLKAAGARWEQVEWEESSISFPERFGLCGCAVTQQFCDSEAEGSTDAEAKGIVIFGGVNATQDFNDAWLLRPTQQPL